MFPKKELCCDVRLYGKDDKYDISVCKNTHVTS